MNNIHPPRITQAAETVLCCHYTMALNCLCSLERQHCLETVSSETVVHLGNGRNKPTGRMGEASSSQGGATPQAEAYYQSHITCCSKNPLLSAAMLGDALLEAF